MNTLLLSLVASFFLVTPPVQAGYSNVVKSVRPIQIVNEDGTLRNICTATSINQTKQYWLTAGHCVGEQMLFISGHAAYTAFLDKKADLAVLQTLDLPTPALKLRPTQPTVEQHIKIVGHPVGLEAVQVFSGRISSLCGPWSMATRS
jgi:hypothetical protein